MRRSGALYQVINRKQRRRAEARLGNQGRSQAAQQRQLFCKSAAARAWFTVWWCLVLALSGCSTKVIEIIWPPAGVCPNTQSGHGGGY
jgi:hypothetical protein